ncbi:putative ABC transporter ATP-binding protein [Burkholderiales bacterium]|nr:putative ABC transporter ATP-binding protein [Burkholderiales bacterium]
MFELAGIEKRHGAALAVAVASWRAESGEAWLLAGPSGSGKSTVLHLIAGLTPPTAGRIVVANRDLASLAPGERDRWRGRTVGLVPQRLHLIGAVSVADNLRLAQRLAGLERDDARVVALLEAVQVADLMHRRPGELSQGQAQRVAIARAVVNRPAVLLADEPTASLDDEHAAAALELLRAQALEAGATLVVASHDARVRPLLPHAFVLPAHAAAPRPA